MNARILIGLLLLLGILVLGLFLRSDTPPVSSSTLSCVPATCCHATSCVSSSEAPSCIDTMCTQECVPGTLDCGQATCALVENVCTLIPHE